MASICSKREPSLEVIPLGGLGEFGMNTMAVSSNGTTVLIDAGVMFPGLNHFGIDLVVPDLSHLRSSEQRLSALFLTHGHEDHIGGVPYVWDLLDGPVYGTKLTLGLLKPKLDEHGIDAQNRLLPVEPSHSVTIGPLEIEFLRVTHSLPDSTALAIHSAAGTIVHTGDYKIDRTPQDGQCIDLERFKDLGCSDFYLTVNYKGKILKAYFEELEADYKVNFIYEKEALGTAGSLCLLKDHFNQPFFVTNCDIIIKADYASLYEFHQKGGYDITLVASTKEYVIPYGTCELNSDGHLSHINEKPKYDFLINTGLYVLNPEVLKLIPEKKFYHITLLIEDAKKRGEKVGVFPIDEDAWIDIGQWAEYQRAVEKL